MTTWTLSDLYDLGCKGQCEQGKLPCTCTNTITVRDGEAFFSYTPPCVIIDSGASVMSEPIPFLGWFVPSSENL